MLDQLRDDHRRILAAADQLEAGLSRQMPADVAGVAKLRWRLLRDVLQHIAVEDRYVRVLGGAALKDATDLRSPDFARMLRHHVAQWSIHAPASAWAEFRSCLLTLLAALRARITFEEEHLYPILRRAALPVRAHAGPGASPASSGGRY